MPFRWFLPSVTGVCLGFCATMVVFLPQSQHRKKKSSSFHTFDRSARNPPVAHSPGTGIGAATASRQAWMQTGHLFCQTEANLIIPWLWLLCIYVYDSMNINLYVYTYMHIMLIDLVNKELTVLKLKSRIATDTSTYHQRYNTGPVSRPGDFKRFLENPRKISKHQMLVKIIWFRTGFKTFRPLNMDVFWWYQWYLGATRGSICQPDVQNMLYLTKPQKKYHISSRHGPAVTHMEAASRSALSIRSWMSLASQKACSFIAEWFKVWIFWLGRRRHPLMEEPRHLYRQYHICSFRCEDELGPWGTSRVENRASVAVPGSNGWHLAQS